MTRTHSGLDARLFFSALAGKTYTVSVFDLDFRGDRAFVYRLAFSTGPKIHDTIPARVQRGSTVELEALGHGLQTGTAQRESIKDTITIPSDPMVTHFQHTLQTPTGVVSIQIPISEMPENIRSDEFSAMSQVEAVTALIRSDETAQRYSIAVMSGEQWSLDVESSSGGSMADLSLEVVDETGKVIAENDDGTVDSDPALSSKPRQRAIIRPLSGR